MTAVLLFYACPTFACPAPTPPQVLIETGTLPVAFDLTRTDQELTAYMRANGDAGWYQSDRPDVKGMLRDQFLLGNRVRFDTHADPQTGKACLAIGQIVVTLRLQATIYLAKGYNKDEAYFHSIFTHENDRFAADRALLGDYAPRLQSGMQLAFSQPSDYAAPPVSPGEVAMAEADLQKSVGDSLKVLFGQILDARAREQRQIDFGR